MEETGHVTFEKRGTGGFHFGCVDASLDWRYDNSISRVDFTFEGSDEGDPGPSEWQRLGQDRGKADGWPNRVSSGRRIGFQSEEGQVIPESNRGNAELYGT